MTTSDDSGQPEVQITQEEADAALEAERADRQRLFEENVDFKLEKLGLDPKKGVGRSIAKDIIRGEYDDDLTLDGLAAYAQSEYGEEIVLDEGKRLTESDTAESLEKAQSEIDQLQQMGGTEPPPSQEVDVIGQLHQAVWEEEAPDQSVVKASLYAKAAQLQEDVRAGKIPLGSE